MWECGTLLDRMAAHMINCPCMLAHSLPHTRTTQSSQRTISDLRHSIEWKQNDTSTLAKQSHLLLLHDARKYPEYNDSWRYFWFHPKGLPNMSTFPDISCHVGDYSHIKHNKTQGLQYLAGVTLGQGWVAYLINLAGIPLNPLSVSELCQSHNWVARADMIWGFWRWSSSIEFR